MEHREVLVQFEGQGTRLDRYLAQTFPDLSRSRIQELIEQGLVLINGHKGKASQRVRGDQLITLDIPPPQPLTVEPEDLPIDVVYEDESIVVIDKPAGLVVHPAPGHPSGTLVNAIVGRWVKPDLESSLRPGIVHRLDKDTSGLMVIARNEKAQAVLAKQLKDRIMLKQYLVLVRGRFPSKKGIIEAPIGRDPKRRKLMAVVSEGREARTRFRVLEEFKDHTLVEATLETGRTHQLRVHFQSIGHPVVGDKVYGVVERSLPLQRQFVHSWRLGLHLPSTGEWQEFQAEPPEDLKTTLETLRAPKPSA